ncbi:hypothetical protein GQ55_5G438000 [Panicum hallii var. hallii]|uniref:Uncharacterized protein n=1 Tax=Panicum hallii var. hallii TaxID=1504633 RepID=A0A2T7DPM2_9POAL|nr:hypothetical protein GQ55_5G438000 [Panicum hallii var. hallii]
MYLQKTVIRADLVGSGCKMAILSTVAKLEGIKSMDIDAENGTLTVVGAVDPVAIVLELKKACLAAAIVSVEDDKPPAPEEPEKEDDPCCRCGEACVQACEEGCVRGGCYCCYYTAFRPAPHGYGWYW